MDLDTALHNGAGFEASLIKMVKIEDCDEDGAIGPSTRVPRNVGVDPQPDTTHVSVKLEEEGQPSSSSSDLRSHFIGMGFSPMMVDKMLQKHGDHNSNSILESLLSHSVSQNSRSESSSSLGSLFDSDNEENSNQEIKPELEPDTFSRKKSYLLSIMNFSQEEVDLAFHQLGEEAPLGELVDCIVTAQGAGFSGGKENGHAINEESLFGEMNKIASLLKMGFAEEEVSSAIDSFGEETTLQELADSIFARRIADTIEQKQVKTEPEFPSETEIGYSTSHQRLSYYDDDDDDKKRVKKSKNLLRDDTWASTSRVVQQPSVTPWSSGRVGTSNYESFKGEAHEMASGSRATIRDDLAKPPYFVYGNLIDITRNAWDELSGFLFSVQPEFVNAQSFSALSRKEGYIHNLPRERRTVLKSQMTIQDRVGQGQLSTLQPHQLERVLGYPADHTNLHGLNQQDRIAAMTFAFQTDTIGHLLSVLKPMYPDGLRVLSIYSGVGGAEIALHRLGIRLKCVVSIEQSEVNRKILRRWWGKTQTGELKQLPSITKLNTTSLEELMEEFGGFDLVVGGTYSSCTGGTTVSAAMGIDYGQFHEYLRVVRRVRNMHGHVV